MMIAMLIAGIACLLAGLLAIGFGIPVNEFSFGNTLILAGALAVCAGLIILSIWAAVRELKNVAERMRSGSVAGGRGAATRPAIAGALPRLMGDESKPEDRAGEDLVHGAETPADLPTQPTVPWQEQAASRDRPRNEAEPAAAAKPRRNLMFSSISRRERERAQARAADPSAAETPATAPAAAPETNEVAPATFDDAWPKSERSRPADLQRRTGRTPATFNEPATGREPLATNVEEHQPVVTVLKSGVVDGMAYSLYSDGSIEAQMPEGMMRFASIDELRAHLDHRP